jgi:hypothetical protein
LPRAAQAAYDAAFEFLRDEPYAMSVAP